MRIAVVVLFSVLASVVDGARIHRSKKPGTNIVNGTPAEKCTWKWQVGLVSSSSGRFFCGGTLIAPNWVVTARHCVKNLTRVYEIKAGSLQNGEGESRRSKRVILNPRSGPGGIFTGQDMALIELEEPYVLGGCIDVPNLPESRPPSDATCYITGWGRLGMGRDQAQILQQAQTEVWAQWACMLRAGPPLFSRTDEFCVSGKYNGKPTSACMGDSGGPLVCQSGDGEYALYGATSRGGGCSGVTIYAGIPSAMDWIKEMVGEENIKDQLVA